MTATPTDDNAPLLRIEDLHTEIATARGVVKPVDGVSLTIRQGHSLGIVGESGSGKTLLGLSLLRLLPAGGRITGGRILFGDKDLATLPLREMTHVRGREIGMIFQDPMTSLNPTMPIGAQVAEPMRIHLKVSADEARDQTLALLKRVGLPQAERRLGSYPHELSGGLRQRVMIATALACGPQLLIADEPTTALDVTIQAQILELIDELRREGLAVILISHDLGVIAGRVDDVAVMYAGRIIEKGPARTIFAEPRHHYTEGLFRSLPERTPLGSRFYSLTGQPPALTNVPAGCRFQPRCAAATQICKDTYPEMISVDREPRQWFACHHPVSVGPATASTHARDFKASARRSDTSAADQVPVALSAQNVSKDFAVRRMLGFGRSRATLSALAGISIEIGRGRVLGLVGESGCGKSTLGRVLAGLETPTGGSVEVFGKPIQMMNRHRARRRKPDVQLMFQDPYSSLDPRMRVGAIIEEPLAIQRIGSRTERRERVVKLLNDVGLPADSVSSYPHEFSGGQRQRIGLARALALDPAVLIADEPVSALDVSVQAQVLNLLREVQSEMNLTVVVISHDVSMISHMADEVGVMYMGKLVEVGETTDVCRRPQHPYTRALLDAVPVADPVVESSRTREVIHGELASALEPPSGCRFRTRCPLAQQVCVDVEPTLQSQHGDGSVTSASHRVACHFPLLNVGRTVGVGETAAP